MVTTLKIKRAIRILKDALLNSFSSSEVIFIVEGSDWVIWKEGLCLSKAIRPYMKPRISSTHLGARKKIIHFASINAFLQGNRVKKVHPSNRVFVTWYHFEPEDKRFSLIPLVADACEKIHTSCTITKELLVRYGAPVSKIFLAPIPIELDVFNPDIFPTREEIKRKYDIPEGKFIIGSFQKDGVGWGEGLDPKLIKGPDIFCDVVIKLHSHIPVHVLLTGPSRGYVKKRLSDAKVPFSHFFLKDPDEVAEFYKCLDAYLMTSRAEGGPKSMAESWAMGVPYIGSRVGMVKDLGNNRVNALLGEGEAEAFKELCLNLFNSKELAENLKENGKITVNNISYSEVIKTYLGVYLNKEI